MRKGDVIKGYRVLFEPTNASGGQCRWSFAERDGRQYFVKEFLTPKYPTPDSPGSPETKERKRSSCQQFEDHHRSLMHALSDLSSGGGGNLITAVDLFLWDTTYFKITEKVDVASVELRDIARRSLRERLLLLLTVSHSVEMLHRKRIVHGDLKPPNILVKVTPKRELTAKLIDFDNAFFAGEPPEDREEVIGDFAYYSPELYRYVVGSGDRSSVGTASDIFALGLIFSEYLTGQKPKFADGTGYACVAIDDGQRLEVPDGTVPDGLRALLGRMLDADSSVRPPVAEIFHMVKEARSKAPDEPPTPLPPEKVDSEGRIVDSPPAEDSLGRLRGLEKFSKTSPAEELKTTRADERPAAGVLRGLEKFKKDERPAGGVLRGLEKFKKVDE